MATIHPPIDSLHLTTPGAYRERDILELLRDGLPDGFEIFHSVDWAAIYQDQQRYGEIDIVVMSPLGHIALLEVKAGDLSFEADQAFKQYGQLKKNISRQIQSQIGNWISRINHEGFLGVRVNHFLVLPDQKVEGSTAQHPRERIVDSGDLPEMCSRLKSSFAIDPMSDELRERLRLFIENKLQIAPDTSTRIDQVSRMSTRLADGLATWVPRISHTDGVFKIQATAGSGKTQLALKLLRDAAEQKKRALYVCYNRPLADHIANLSPTSTEVSTFHELSVENYRRKVAEPNFTDPSFFDQAATLLIEGSSEIQASLDLLIIDEYQDFEAGWIQALLAKLKENSKLYVMGDSQQDLYERDDFDLPDAVQIKSLDNFRSPQRVVDVINQLQLTPEPIQPKSAYLGDLPEFISYKDPSSGGIKEIEKCITSLLSKGYKHEEIAVLSFAGRNKSKLLQLDNLGAHNCKRFTGNYDSSGNPQWSVGNVLTETIYRFKGQSAPVVILSEIDFETMTNKELRKLFVGMTRAKIHLICIMSDRAQEQLAQRLN
jgi:Holliday junction resolvase-like predicted endonuclease